MPAPTAPAISRSPVSAPNERQPDHRWIRRRARGRESSADDRAGHRVQHEVPAEHGLPDDTAGAGVGPGPWRRRLHGARHAGDAHLGGNQQQPRRRRRRQWRRALREHGMYGCAYQSADLWQPFERRRQRRRDLDGESAGAGWRQFRVQRRFQWGRPVVERRAVIDQPAVLPEQCEQRRRRCVVERAGVDAARHRRLQHRQSGRRRTLRAAVERADAARQRGRVLQPVRPRRCRLGQPVGLGDADQLHLLRQPGRLHLPRQRHRAASRAPAWQAPP